EMCSLSTFILMRPIGRARSCFNGTTAVGNTALIGGPTILLMVQLAQRVCITWALCLSPVRGPYYKCRRARLDLKAGKLADWPLASIMAEQPGIMPVRPPVSLPPIRQAPVEPTLPSQ